MCLAIPGQLKEVTDESELMPMGRVDFGGISKEICLAYVPEAQIGDYLLVHVGFALSIVQEDEATRIFEAFDELEVRLELENKAT